MKAGCYYCLEMFDTGEVENYVDEGRTPLCPNCGVDSVMYEDSSRAVDYALLVRLHDYWFAH